jgi:hypothetical protein
MNRIVIAPFLFFQIRVWTFCELHGHFFGLYASVLACSAGQLPDRAHLDATNAGGWHEGGDVNGVVQVPGVNQVKAGQLLISFGERAITYGDFAIADPDGSGGMDRLKCFRGQALTAFAERIVVGHTLIIRHGSDLLFFAVDQA